MRNALSNLLGRLLLATRSRRSQGTADLHLSTGSILRATGPLTLLPTRGTLWVTQPNDPQDHLLTPGQPWRTARPGPILIQSLTPAAFTLRAPSGTYVSHILQPVATQRRSPHRPRALRRNPAHSSLFAQHDPSQRCGVVH